MKTFKWPVWFLIFLGTVVVEKEVTALKIGDVGVCKTKIISITNKRVTYTKFSSTKWCGKRRCIVRVSRMQPFTQTKEQATCCKGFEYQSEDNICVPRCTIGCHGGRCVAPDICQCEAPLYLDPVHQNTCIAPVCDPPCVNAVCSANNTCTCLVGYSTNASFACAPICEQPCVNGECIAPDTCSCSPGYIRNESNCEPACNCVNAQCVTPDSCTCLEGYTAINATHCEPVCEGCDGNCVAPNKCECFEGYVLKEEWCQPVCEPQCENGYCSKPNQCTCFEGYKYNETSGLCVKDEDRCEETNCLSGHGEGECKVNIQ